MLFRKTLAESLVDAGVYLNLHPDCSGVIEEAAATFTADELVQVGLVVTTVKGYSVEHFMLELRKRAIKEQDSEERDRMLLLIEIMSRRNQVIAERVANRLAA